MNSLHLMKIYLPVNYEFQTIGITSFCRIAIGVDSILIQTLDSVLSFTEFILNQPNNHR